MANALKNLGVKKGEAVAMYLPMCPELVVSMLACTKIGALHSVVYSGLSVGAFVGRMNHAEAKILITADGTYRKGKIIDLKKISDEAMLQCPTIETVVVVQHTGNEIEVSDLSGKEIFYERLLEGEPAECEPEHMDAEIDCLYCTHREQPVNQRVYFILQADTWWECQQHSKTSLIYTEMICGGAQVILDG